MARTRSLRPTTVVLLCTAILVAGCKNEKGEANGSEPPGDEDAVVAAEGSDTAAVESDMELITSSLVSASPGSIGLASADLNGGDLGTSEFGDGAKAIYFPRGCLQAVNDPATQTATYTFSNCTGPGGLRAVTGEIKAHYQQSGPGQLHLDLTATDLSVNRATTDWSAIAEITTSGADRAMTWDAHLSGTSAGGRTLSRSTKHRTKWKLGDACFGLDGSSEGQVGEREIRTEISSFRRCRRECPDAGGKIVVTNVTKNKRYELHYDGTNRATFIGPNGKERSIPLLCRQ
jgi:hypothetical protein